MNHEILFRGKREDNREWVEGHYFLKDDISLPGLWKSFILKQNEVGNVLWIEVDPTTVGQYTGLTDKNGAKIFMGDIVRCEEWYIGGPPDSAVILPVEFADGGYAAGQYPLSNWLFDSARGNIKLDGVNIIGNIHDNPELLEEAQDGN